MTTLITASVTTVSTIPGRVLDAQGAAAISTIEFSLDTDGTAQLRCPEDVCVSLTGLASGYGLEQVRRFHHHGWKVLVVSGTWEHLYRLWRRCSPSNIQGREAFTRQTLLDHLEQGLTRKAARALA